MAITVTIVAGKTITVLMADGTEDSVGLRPTTEIGMYKRASPVLPAGYTETPQWIVWVRNSDKSRPLVLAMGTTNIGAWTNDLTGAIAARAQIAAALP
jgi:hypothetical protein